MAPRVAFIRLRSLGDTILMTPALEVAKRAHATTAVVVERPFDRILERNPSVDLVLPVETSGKIVARLKLIRRLRQFRPDTVVDLHGGSTSAIMAACSGARRRVGYQKSQNSYLYNCQVPDSRTLWGKESIHTVEHQLSPLKQLGFQIDPIPSPFIPIQDGVLKQARLILDEVGIQPGFVLIHPGAAFHTKQWEAERFRDLGSRLISAGFSVVATAGPGEERDLEVVGQAEGLQVIAPLELPTFAALASMSRLYIGNDTGTTHLAAALNRPVLVIFGSSDSEVWHPWKTRYELIRSQLPCIPCPGYSCLHYQEPLCIRSIEVDRVLESALGLLAEGVSN